MRIQIVTASVLLSLSNLALAANPTHRLRPNDAAALKAARIDVSCRVVRAKGGTEYAFEISAGVPDGFDSLDAWFAIRNDKGLVVTSSWSSSQGKCVAAFMVGEQAIEDAWFSVQLYKGEKLKNPWAASGAFSLKLSDFTGTAEPLLGPATLGKRIAHSDADFEITAPIKIKGPTLTIAVKRKDAFSNYLYDVHVVVKGRSDQHFEVRNGQPITKDDIRLANLNADNYLDIMIVGGKDDRGEDWYKTLIYNEKKKAYRWLTD